MKIWDDIVSTALVGTEREQPPLVTAGGELDQMLSRVVSNYASSPAALVPRMAALIELFHRCGRVPSTIDVPRGEPCPEEKTGTACGARSAAHVSTLIQ